MSFSSTGIIFFSADDWSENYQTRHHIANKLSDNHQIIWINRPKYFYELTLRDILKNLFKRRIKKIKDNLWIIDTKLPIDYSKHYNVKGIIPRLFKIYSYFFKLILGYRINYFLNSLKLEYKILYLWRPEFYWTRDFINFDLSCYHIDDDYAFNSEKDEEISTIEETLIKNSNIVFIHSKTLFQKKGFYNSNTHIIPNGVDIDLFSNFHIPKNINSQEINRIPFPRIGYVGNIKKHLDLNIVYQIAKSKKEWNFIFIGDLRRNHSEITEVWNKLLSLKNFFYLGKKNSQDLPYYINEMDVCIMPYKLNAYTKYIYPLKMHEYFACGKNVVSSHLENVLEFKNNIYLANSISSWIKQLEIGMNTNNSETLKSIAQNNTWSSRANKINELIFDELLKK